jgi:DNA-binding Xre family transcriptional regulator
MTRLGTYLAKRAINKAEVARKTGLSTKRLSELSLNESTKLKASELYLIALAIQVSPAELLEEMCGDLKLID